MIYFCCSALAWTTNFALNDLTRIGPPVLLERPSVLPKPPRFFPLNPRFSSVLPSTKPSVLLGSLWQPHFKSLGSPRVFPLSPRFSPGSLWNPSVFPRFFPISSILPGSPPVLPWFSPGFPPVLPLREFWCLSEVTFGVFQVNFLWFGRQKVRKNATLKMDVWISATGGTETFLFQNSYCQELFF